MTLRRKKKAAPNPWNASTLEWQTASPPPHGNFPEPVTVYHGPYDYSLPGLEEDFVPQNRPLPKEAFEVTLSISSSKSFQRIALGLEVIESPLKSKMFEIVLSSSSQARFLSSTFFESIFCILFLLKFDNPSIVYGWSLFQADLGIISE
jgi:hypothetical protein